MFTIWHAKDQLERTETVKINEQNLHSREYIKVIICQNRVVFHSFITHMSVFVAHFVAILCKILSKTISNYKGWNTKIGIRINVGFPSGACIKESVCQCRRCKRHGFDSWVGKRPWRRKWQLTPVFLLGKFRGQRGPEGYSWTCRVGAVGSWPWLSN